MVTILFAIFTNNVEAVSDSDFQLSLLHFSLEGA